MTANAARSREARLDKVCSPKTIALVAPAHECISVVCLAVEHRELVRRAQEATREEIQQ